MAMAMMEFFRKRKRLEYHVIDDLPKELLFEIFVKLSIKSIQRCKCVSKRWNSLISDSYFARLYTLSKPKYSPSQSIVLGRYKNSGGDEDLFKHPGFTFSFLPTFKHIHILGSCNGLVLCGESSSDPCPYYVCNPLTMQWLEIPHPPPPLPTRAFLLGFVCDANALEFASYAKYNVVLIPTFSGLKNEFEVQIFSFDTMKWSESKVNCPRGIRANHISRKLAVCCNGVLYWLVDRHGIIACNIYNKIDQCSFIDLPKTINIHDYSVKELIGICQDRLRLGLVLSSHRLQVWELRNSEWTCEYNISLRNNLMLDGATINYEPSHLLAIDGINRDVVYVLANACIIRFDLKNKRLESKSPNTMPIRSLIPLASPFILPWWPTPLPTLNQKLRCKDHFFSLTSHDCFPAIL